MSYPLYILVLMGLGIFLLSGLVVYLVSVRSLKLKLLHAETQSSEQSYQQSINEQLYQQQQLNDQNSIAQWQQQSQSLQQKLDEQLEMRQQLSITQAADGQKIENLSQHLQQQLQENQALKNQLELKQTELGVAQRELATLQIQLQDEKIFTQEKLALLEQTKEKMSQEFNRLANNIMEQNSEKFGKTQQQSLDTILTPFKDQLGEFRKRVDHVYDTESRDRVSLLKEIDGLRQLNQQITEEASNLTRALKGDRKAQGNWGEVILERVLEASGLQNGREYETQKHLKSEAGDRYHPDVVIHLPDKKDIIVDAKVSLSAYERYYSGQDENENQIALKQHIKAVRNHVEKLSEKSYEDLVGLNTLDFVFIFIPIEPAYLLALQEDQNLLTDAFSKKVIIVSPTTLLATLRIIENLWRFERQSKNAVEIARQAGRLYDKFVSFVSDLDDVENKIIKSLETVTSAKKKLHTGKGDLISSTEKLKLLGAKTTKQMNEKLLEESND